MRKALLPLLLFVATAVTAQLTMPPDGANQRASVTQSSRLVKVTIDYSSPQSPQPAHRRRPPRKDLGEARSLRPGRPRIRHVQGMPVARRREREHSLHCLARRGRSRGRPSPPALTDCTLIPGENEWTIVFSKNNRSWGSFFYDPAEDQLRVNAKPGKSEYHEFLT